MYSPADTRLAIAPAASPASLPTPLAPAPRQMATGSGGGTPPPSQASPSHPFSLGSGSEKTLLIQDSDHYRWAFIYGPQYSIELGGRAEPRSMLIVFTDKREILAARRWVTGCRACARFNGNRYPSAPLSLRAFGLRGEL